MKEEMHIPKIIHYCWFGGNEIPDTLQECMKTWDVLKSVGYQFICWDETNCSFNENDFVKRAYAEKRWGFIGDYYRAKALYTMGGIYLDTDIVVKKPFDELLTNRAFIGFSSDYAICTAAVGAEKGSGFIKGILNMYENGEYISEKVVLGLEHPEDNYKKGIWTPSNEFWGWYIIKKYPDFILNNKKQNFNEVTVYPKTYFELGSLSGNYYCRHMNCNTWRNKQTSRNPAKRLKRWLEKNEKCWIMIRRIVSIRAQQNNNFYDYYKMIGQKKVN